MKKTIALLLAMMMTVSLAACGNSASQEADSSSAQASSQDSESAGAQDQTVPSEPASSAEPEAQEPSAENAGSLTAGQTLLKDFEEQMGANPDETAQSLADGILSNEIIGFSSASVPVEPGLLTGFGNAEITGFKDGVMFAPAIGTIPFVGYIFVLEDDEDVEGFINTLEENADPRWNICTEAEETVTGHAGNTVFFVMSPKSLEE